MKFVRFDGGKTGLVVDIDGLQVVDVHAAQRRLRDHDGASADEIARVLPDASGQSWTDMIGEWDEVRKAFQTLNTVAENGPDSGLEYIPLADARLEAPLASPTVKIFAVGGNTSAHFVHVNRVLFDRIVPPEDAYKTKEAGLPTIGFTVWPSTVVGPDATVAPPKGTLKFDYEAECAVYVKRGGRYLDTVELWGYTAFNDLGIRDGNLKLAKEPIPAPGNMNMSKNFDNGKAIGPWVVVDEGHDVANLRCTLTVNGELRQDWNLSEMIYGFDEVLSHISMGISLSPGDMLSGGTGEGSAIESGIDGPNWLKPGDVVEIKLDGAGTLRNVVGTW